MLKTLLKKISPEPVWFLLGRIYTLEKKYQYRFFGRPYIPAETLKAKERRQKEGFFKKYCRGRGIDIGYGGDPVTNHCVKFDFENGDAQYLKEIKNENFDFVYSSHVLEHMKNPEAALKNWWRILKPGGFLILYVPERDLYEKKKTLPSRFNADHKSFFLLNKSEGPDTQGLIPMIKSVLEGSKIIYGKICNNNYKVNSPLVLSEGEFSIEVVVMKQKRSNIIEKLDPGYSVVLPTFKERKNLEILIPNLLSLFKKLKKDCEIIVVDDASDDGTREFVKKLKKQSQPVVLIERRKEKGPFSAIVRGTDKASGSNIIHMDSDRVHEIFDLERLIAIYEQGKSRKVLIGSRYIQGSVYRGKPFLNKIASKLGGLIINYYIGLPIKDASNNFRIFPKSAWQKIRPRLILEGNVGFVHELVLMKRFGYELLEVPTTYIEKRIGKSSLRKRLWKETKKFFKNLSLIRQDIRSVYES